MFGWFKKNTAPVAEIDIFDFAPIVPGVTASNARVFRKEADPADKESRMKDVLDAARSVS
jgi:hypothetical protein